MLAVEVGIMISRLSDGLRLELKKSNQLGSSGLDASAWLIGRSKLVLDTPGIVINATSTIWLAPSLAVIVVMGSAGCLGWNLLKEG